MDAAVVGVIAASSNAGVAVAGAMSDGAEAVVVVAWLAGSVAAAGAVAAGCAAVAVDSVSGSVRSAVAVVAGGLKASVVAATADARYLACAVVDASGEECGESDAVGVDGSVACEVAVVVDDAECGEGCAAGLYDVVGLDDDAEMRACVGVVVVVAGSGETEIGRFLDTAVAVVDATNPSRG